MQYIQYIRVYNAYRNERENDIYKVQYTMYLYMPVLHSCLHKHENIFLFSGQEPIYFIENKEKTLRARASYDRGTQIFDYMV